MPRTSPPQKPSRWQLLLTHHPDHDVGQAGDPDGGGDEGHHEPVLPAPLGTVGHGEEEEEAERPHDQPLQLVTPPRWGKTRGGGERGRGRGRGGKGENNKGGYAVLI